jgi:hypothetical protein
MKGRITKYVTWYMVLAMVILGITPRVQAGFSPSEGMQVGALDRSSDLKAIQKVLELKMISERLRQLGFTEEGIQQRLSQLSDEQLHRLALKLDEMRVGGDGEVVISLLVIAILVLILVYLLGHKIAITKG